MNRILGIDQCGALGAHGQPKPMKSVLFDRRQGFWTFKALEIESLSRKSLLNLKVDAIVLDSVMGLPHDAWPIQQKSAAGLWKLFRKAAKEPAYGKSAGENFFKSLTRKKNFKLSRICEDIADANSVFTTRPFQKNIQTGSFRSWRDLGREKKFLNVWPFETKFSFEASHPWIFEGYPSWVWKKILKNSKRSPKNLKKILSEKSEFEMKPASRNEWKLIESSHDSADAFVLGFLLAHLVHEKKLDLFPSLPESALHYEGWILGVESSISI